MVYKSIYSTSYLNMVETILVCMIPYFAAVLPCDKTQELCQDHSHCNQFWGTSGCSFPFFCFCPRTSSSYTGRSDAVPVRPRRTRTEQLWLSSLPRSTLHRDHPHCLGAVNVEAPVHPWASSKSCCSSGQRLLGTVSVGKLLLCFWTVSTIPCQNPHQLFYGKGRSVDSLKINNHPAVCHTSFQARISRSDFTVKSPIWSQLLPQPALHGTLTG